MATCLQIARIEYPSRVRGRQVIPLEGRSLLPVFAGRERTGHDALFWEFMRNKAVRKGKWKLVTLGKNPWELYDMEADRTEQNNLASKMPEKVKELSGLYEAWAKRCKAAKNKGK